MNISNIVVAYFLLAVALVITAFAQVAFRHYHVAKAPASLWTAIALFICVPPVSYFAVKYLGIGKVYVLTSLTYGLVAFLGWRLLGEKVNRAQLQGLALITIGCLLYSL